MTTLQFGAIIGLNLLYFILTIGYISFISNLQNKLTTEINKINFEYILKVNEATVKKILEELIKNK